MQSLDHLRANYPRRRGASYVFVLSCATLCAVAGLAGVAAQRARLHTVELSSACQRANVDARSSLEYVIAMLKMDPTGRSWRTSNTFSRSAAKWLGRGASSTTITISDPADSDLGSSTGDPALVMISSVMGDAQAAYSVEVSPVKEAKTCLNYAVIAAGGISPGHVAKIFTSGPIQDGGAWYADSSRAFINVGLTLDNAETNANGMTSIASPAVPVDALTGPCVPEWSNFKWYTANATPITNKTLTKIALGPGANPFGAANADGIYVIDGGGGTVTLDSCRIVGTLIIVNGDLRINNFLSMEAANPGWPALIVQGAAQFTQGSKNLSEAAQAVNFNPAGVPFEGATDSDTTDSLDGCIKGQVFVGGNLVVGGTPTVQGTLVVCGNISISSGELRVRYNKPQTPPEGYYSVTGLAIVPGSFQVEVN